MRFLFGLTVSVAALMADSVDFSRYTVILTKVNTAARDGTEVIASARLVLAVLDTVAYDRNWSTGAFLLAHPSVRSRLERLSLVGRALEPRYLSDGTVTVGYEYDLCGAVLRLLMPQTGQGVLVGRCACPLCGQE